MRKSRVFMILHRQPHQFRDIREYATTHLHSRLRDYLDECLDPFVLETRPYILTRISGGYQRPAYIFDPDQDEPLPFLYNYGNDRSAYLVRDKRVPGGLRAFSVAEFARLSTIDPDTFRICGSMTSRYHQVADCVYPAVAEAVGRALNEYFAAIPALYEPAPDLGFREVVAFDVQREKPARQQVEPIRAEQVGLWSSIPSAGGSRSELHPRPEERLSQAK